MVLENSLPLDSFVGNSGNCKEVTVTYTAEIFRKFSLFDSLCYIPNSLRTINFFLKPATKLFTTECTKINGISIFIDWNKVVFTSCNCPGRNMYKCCIPFSTVEDSWVVTFRILCVRLRWILVNVCHVEDHRFSTKTGSFTVFFFSSPYVLSFN